MSDYIVTDESVILGQHYTGGNWCGEVEIGGMDVIPFFRCTSSIHFDCGGHPWETTDTTAERAVKAMLNLTKNVWARH